MGIAPEYKVPWREEIRASGRGLGLVFVSSPLNALAAIATTGAQGVLPAVIVGATGFLLSAIPAVGTGAPPGRFRNAIVVLAGAILLQQVIGPLNETAVFGMQRKFQAFLARRIMTSLSRLPGMAYFEDPAFRDKLKIAEWIGWAPAQSVRILGQVFQQGSQLMAMAAVAVAYSWWVPAIVIGGSIPAAILGVVTESQVALARWRYSPEARRSDYYRNLALQVEPAKEVRIFGLREWISERHYGFWLKSMDEAWRIRRRQLLLKLGLRGPTLVGLMISYISMLSAVVSGRIGLPLFAATSLATVGMVVSVSAVSESVAWLRRGNYYLPVAFQIMDLPASDPRLVVSGTKPAHDPKRSGIRFDGVTFVYPGTERKVLDRLDLWIPVGSSLALVGENGTGKTTLIKLLCRFYDPVEGNIFLDGIDIREFDLADLRTRLAVIFQDFFRYNLSAADNVGFGAVGRLADREMLEEAAREVGMLEKIKELPEGWGTPLAREFGGVDLSGGEWQRIALARAIAAKLGRDADMLILDEPTASLDVRLEHELYEHFTELSGGRTTLLVSHRFSTVRMAERIVYVEDGRIVEDGTHEELMALQGRYAELYQLQASHYRLTGALE